MTLISKLGEIKEKAVDLTELIKSPVLPMYAFLAGRLCDDISTYLCASKYGIEGEQTFLARKFMEKCGAGKGMFVYDLLIVPPALLIAYGLNKLGEKNDLPGLGNFGLLCIGAVWYCYGLSNFSLM